MTTNSSLDGVARPPIPELDFNAKDGAKTVEVPISDMVHELSKEPIQESPDNAVIPEDNSAAKVVEAVVDSSVSSVATFSVDQAEPLDPKSFPNRPRIGSNQPPSTIPNARHLLASYGITARYNVVSQKLLITVPGCSGAPDNADNVAMTQIISLASLNGMSSGQMPSFVAVIGDRNQFNPVAEWITSKKWDGIDRLQDICDTLVHREDYSEQLKKQLIHRWLISAVAATFKPSGFRSRGVLTLQGSQSLGKTTWVASLVPDLILRETTVKLDHHLDAGNKDSLITAVSHWIVEIGELDSSFKKDVARLKGFLTSDRDKVRRPYGRTDSEYPRRTVFAATVNENNFLVDATGNTRWWTIPVTKINYSHGIDMQQLFAQVTVDFEKGEKWWLTQEEETQLESFNMDHRSVSVIRERVLGAVDLERSNALNLPAMTPSEMLIDIGIKSPTNAQCKECAGIFREYFGEHKRIRGVNKWRIPLRQSAHALFSTPHSSGQAASAEAADDLY